MIDLMKKLITEAIQYAVDELKFIEDQNLAYLNYWMKNKAQNKVFSLKWLVDSAFLPCNIGEVGTSQMGEMWALLTWWESQAKRYSKTANKANPWKAHNL